MPYFMPHKTPCHRHALRGAQSSTPLPLRSECEQAKTPRGGVFVKRYPKDRKRKERATPRHSATISAGRKRRDGAFAPHPAARQTEPYKMKLCPFFSPPDNNIFPYRQNISLFHSLFSLAILPIAAQKQKSTLRCFFICFTRRNRRKARPPRAPPFLRGQRRGSIHRPRR